MRSIDEQVYSLYANPLLTNGMSKEDVERLVAGTSR